MASFNNSIRPQFLLLWMWGIWAMVFLHHFGVSILMYKNRSQSASNFLKIIFNASGLARGVFAMSSVLVPDDVSSTTCQAFGYLAYFVNAFFRMSLSAFLLWRIKQIEFKRSDMFIGFTLFAITSSIQILRAFIHTFYSMVNPVTNNSFCNSTSESEAFIILNYISISADFAIDIFVTFRLIQVLRRANRNAHFVASNMQRPFKRTLFTSVMYWNFIRLGLSFIYQAITLYNFRNPALQPVYALPAVFTFVYVALAYTITADAEIVRVIEGRTNMSGSAGIDKPPFKPFGFRHGPKSTTKESTEYIISTPSFNMTTSQQTEKIDTNTVSVSSIKRLSFFEWAKFVVGKKDKNETNNPDGEQGSIEEIEEKLSVPEYNVVVTKEETRRESDHSLATTVIDSATLSSKDNHNSMV